MKRSIARRKRRRQHRHVYFLRDVPVRGPSDGADIVAMLDKATADLPKSRRGRVCRVNFQHDDDCRTLVTRSFPDCNCERINIRLELRELEG